MTKWLIILKFALLFSFSGRFLMSSTLSAEPQDSYLRIGVPNQIGGLDPIKSTNFHTRELIYLAYQHLVKINFDQELEPVLAKSWTFSEGSDRKIILTLKKGQIFSDGSTVKAEHVKASLERACSKESDESHNLQGLKGCKETHAGKKTLLGVIIIDDETIQFEITGHPTLFLYQLTTQGALVSKVTEKGLLGSGPYRFSSIEPRRLVLEKNPYFTGSLRNDGIIAEQVEETELSTHLKDKKIDGLIVYHVGDTEGIAHVGYRDIEDKASITLGFALNSKHFPFNKTIVRKALAAELYNQDRIYQCRPGSKKAYGIIPLGIGGSVAHMAPEKLRVFSTEEVLRAVPRLKKKTTALIHRHVGRKNPCEETILVDAAKKFNIDLKLQYHDSYATLWPLYLNNSIDGYLEFFVFYKREAFNQLRRFLSSSEFNPPNFRDPELDQMIEDSWAAANSSLRFAGYRKVNQFLQDEALFIPLHYANHTSLMSECIDGISPQFHLSPFQGLPGLFRKKDCKGKG